MFCRFALKIKKLIPNDFKFTELINNANSWFEALNNLKKKMLNIFIQNNLQFSVESLNLARFYLHLTFKPPHEPHQSYLIRLKSLNLFENFQTFSSLSLTHLNSRNEKIHESSDWTVNSISVMIPTPAFIWSKRKITFGNTKHVWIGIFFIAKIFFISCRSLKIELEESFRTEWHWKAFSHCFTLHIPWDLCFSRLESESNGN